ncbi:oxidoreductase [Clavibacter tessellarius]|uniref:oxidoreductase n=1 Tax=Clavibacter tessellarius TaxID=31965 RepID=UPI00324B9065
MNHDWTEQQIPDQSGRVAIVTGANTGLGFETARMLAEHGATVVLAVRDVEKGRHAASRITGDVRVQALDLTSLDSVRSTASDLRAEHERIDLLINNAGVMHTPKKTTADGFELQFGTNHLGHFALTGLLLDRLLPVAGSRVVTVSSIGHRMQAAIHFDDLQWDRSYSRTGAYGQSKLANLMFTYELQRRLATHGTTVAVAAHPGLSDTEAHAQRACRVPPARGLAHAADDAARGDGRPADGACCDRPGRPRRPVLRTRQPQRDPGPPEDRHLQPGLARPGGPAAPVDGVGGAHRGDVPRQHGPPALTPGTRTGPSRPPRRAGRVGRVTAGRRHGRLDP